MPLWTSSSHIAGVDRPTYRVAILTLCLHSRLLCLISLSWKDLDLSTLDLRDAKAGARIAPIGRVAVEALRSAKPEDVRATDWGARRRRNARRPDAAAARPGGGWS